MREDDDRDPESAESRGDAIVQAHFNRDDQRPDLVFHYTSPEGLRGILTTRTIWATHSRFVNDYSEHGRAFDVFVKELRRSAPSDVVEGIGRYVLENEVVRGFGTFLVCFSSKPDLLSQWRAYSADGAGFALGLRAKEIVSSRTLRIPESMDAGTVGPVLVPVVYDEAAQKAAVAEIVNLAIDEARACRDAKRPVATPHALRCLSHAAVQFKQPAFEEEGEWRLVWTGPFQMLSPHKNVPLRFRFTQFGLAPYLDWPAKTVDGKSFVKRVVIGPRRSAEEETLAAYLVSLGYQNFKVETSGATYR